MVSRNVEHFKHTKQVFVSPSSSGMVIAALASKEGPITLDLETTSLNVREPGAAIVGMGVHDMTTNTSYYFPVGHRAFPNVPIADLRSFAQRVRRPMAYHNAKFDWKWLRAHVTTSWPIPTHDTYIIVKLLNFLGTGKLKEIGIEKGLTNATYDEVAEGRDLRDLPPQLVGTYCMRDCEITALILMDELPSIEASKSAQVYHLETKFLPVVVQMEETGMLIDKDILVAQGEEYARLKHEHELSVWAKFKETLGCGSRCHLPCSDHLSYCEIPLHSSQKLSEMLYSHIGLPTDGIRKTTRGYSTDADSLEALYTQTHEPFLKEIMLYKESLKAAGMVGTYTDAIDPGDHRIHADLRQVWVISGRLACGDPNLQQVPHLMRKAFVPAPGYYFWAGDFSQIEMRIFASLANAKKLLEAFHNQEDIHSKTASIVNGIDISQVSKTQRQAAKAVNFGMIYGQTARGLAGKLQISDSAAERILGKLNEGIPELPRFVEDSTRSCRQEKGVYTAFGRWVPIPEIASSNRWEREKAGRLAVNARIQGTAADVMKLALVRVADLLLKKFPGVRMLMTVHDEIDLEVPNSVDVKELTEALLGVMEMDFGAVHLGCEAEWGPNWSDLKPIDDIEQELPPEVLPSDIQINLALCHQAGMVPEVSELLDSLSTSDGVLVDFQINGKIVRTSGPFDSILVEMLERLDPIHQWYRYKGS